jgi:mercuric reductase
MKTLDGSVSNMQVDLVIVGGGSAAFAAAIKTSELGGRAVIINEGLPIGGTCVNVGCVPSKALIRAAEAVHRGNQKTFDGIRSRSDVVDFEAVTRQTENLVLDLRQAKYIDVVADDPNIEIVEGRGILVDEHTVSVGDRTVKAKSILLATGARSFVPDIPGLSEVDYLTNESAYALTELPSELIVLGGRYIALENAQLFARLGSKVTLLQRSSRILPTESEELTTQLSGYLSAEGLNILTDVSIESVHEDDGRVVVEAMIDGVKKTVSGSHIFVATGRRGNTEGLGLENLGVETFGRGYLRVDDTLRTSVSSIFAAGDVTGENQFVYTAAYEGSLVAENASVNMFKKRDYSALPWVVFTDPQVAGVGMNEAEAEEAGIEYEVARLDLEHVPRSIAARDTRGFITLIRDAGTDLLLGARILAPEGSELLMEVVLAMKHGITVAELTSAFHPYLTLSEGIKLAAITFGKDVGKLSCCAV